MHGINDALAHLIILAARAERAAARGAFQTTMHPLNAGRFARSHCPPRS